MREANQYKQGGASALPSGECLCVISPDISIHLTVHTRFVPTVVNCIYGYQPVLTCKVPTQVCDTT